MTDYPAIAELVPHAAPILELERMLDWKPGRVECEMTVRAASRFVEEGLLRSVFTIEHMAQAVAACLGYEAFRGGQGVRVGMIVACREFRAEREAVPVGETLRVVVERIRGNISLSHFDCAVYDGVGAIVSTAVMTLVHDQPARSGPQIKSASVT